jgi:uncharacterized repeat protein (TIGR03843 family)
VTDDDGEGRRIEIALLPAGLERSAVLSFLSEGEMEPIGRLATASNITLLCRVSLAGAGAGGAPLVGTCVYKPIRGEAPLWDFPDGTLAHREVAAFAVSEATGWDIVPPTVLRDGPYGEGMVQLWIDVDESIDVVDLVRHDDPCLRPLAVFDAVVNNADRKAGHLLPTAGGHVHGVDHGVCFAVEPKLRTVLWGWMGDRLSREELDVLRRLRRDLDGSLGSVLAQQLARGEVTATARRLDRLVEARRFPSPDPGRPAIPWPWY